MCAALEKLLRLEDPASKLVVDSWEYITEYDASELVPEKAQHLVNLEPIKDEKLAKRFGPLMRPMTLPGVSNVLKHYRALTKIAAQTADPNPNHAHLILEDDVCFDGNIRTNLENALRHPQRPADADILFCGYPHTIPQREKEPFIAIDGVFEVLPGCDSYIVSPAVAKRLLTDFVPFKFVYNVQLSYLIAKHGLKAYMCRPNLFVEGSKLGIYTSAIQMNNILAYNQAYVEMLQIVQKPAFVAEDKEKMDALYAACKFPNHPDMLYIRGVFYMKDGKYHQAKEVFDKAYEEYMKGGLKLDKTSLFLKRYIDVFKFVQ
jgi:hypothetical protein